MKKLLLTLAVLCGTVSGWAQSATMPVVSDAPTDGNWAENTTWYTIKNGDGNYVNKNYADNDGNLQFNNKTATLNDVGLWCIVGNDNDGYLFYNRETGVTKALQTTGDEANARTKFVDVATATKFFFTESKKAGGYWCVKIAKEGNNYWNSRGSYIALWNSTDAVNGWQNSGNGDNGSALLFEIVSPISDLGTIAANGSLTAPWITSTWKESSNIPAEVTGVEKNQYPNKTSNIRTVSMSINVPQGYVKSSFVFADGNNRIEALGAELLDEDGNVVSHDYHFGFCGHQKSNNIYTLAASAAGVYTIRYWVTFCSEQNTSNGRIVLNHFNVLPLEKGEDFSNNKIYTVTPADYATTGVWDVNAEKTRLSISEMAETKIDPTSKNQQFAFLNVNNEFYLYSYGAEKFVAKDGNGQKLTDELSSACLVKFLASTHTDQVHYPIVVQVGGSQLHSTYQPDVADPKEYCGIITSWNNTGSGGNALSILPVDGDVDLSSAVAKIEAYQIAREKTVLKGLIDEAIALAGKTYLGETNIAALNAAKQIAQSVYDSQSATYADVLDQITALTQAINDAAYVTTVEGFSNNAIYTFVSNRNAEAYMMYDPATPDYVASRYMKTSLEVGEQNANCQWVVYKSSRGYYYMYNIGAQKFMGTESAANTSIPFSAIPQTTGLIFKTTAVASHPIMFSTNNGAGAANHSNNAFDGKNKAGLVNWDGGYGYNQDPGNVHKVAIVGAIDEELLNTITAAVELFETRGIEILAFGEYLDNFYKNYYDAWGSGWRNQPGFNNYSQPEEDEPLDEAYANAVLYYKQITDETPLQDIRDQKAYLEGLEARLTINQPTNGQFVRLRCTEGKKYLQSTTNTSNNRLTMTNNTGVESYFTYYNGNLISYTTGKSADHRVFNEIGNVSEVIFSKAHNGVIGCYNIKVGENYIYGFDSDLDSGTNPDDRNGYNWWLEKVNSIPVTITSAEYATFYCPVAVTLPDGLKAYYVSSTTNDKAQMTEITGAIPANTGVILQGKANTYNLTIGGEAKEVESKLSGTVASEYISTPSYVLSAQGTPAVVGFYKAMMNQQGETFLNNGFKAYLPANGNNARALVFDFGTETAIESIESVENNAVVYDLAGRRVQNAQKGIFIVNGKKVIK